jgi:hypothetical protein
LESAASLSMVSILPGARPGPTVDLPDEAITAATRQCPEIR